MIKFLISIIGVLRLPKCINITEKLFLIGELEIAFQPSRLGCSWGKNLGIHSKINKYPWASAAGSRGSRGRSWIFIHGTNTV